MEIVGIVLVRDEDRHIERAVRNVAAFCDRLILADHKSRDRTPQILMGLADALPHATYVPIADPSESHELIRDLAGTPTWVFGVDGDELYDPAGLAVLKEQLRNGDYDAYWALFGNVLNCTSLDTATGQASGYLAPPCRSMTKLYNFAAIEAWSGPCPQRLHGGTLHFREGYSEGLRCNLQKTCAWEASCFRCLHLCWLSRSSLDGDAGDGSTAMAAAGRRNVTELGSRGVRGRIRDMLRGKRGAAGSSWKQEKYRRGELVTKDVSPFFVQDDERREEQEA